MTDTSVKLFTNAMPGAPVLSGTSGALISLLDTCLVTGFGSVTVDSLSVSSNTATLFASTGHGFSEYSMGFGVFPVIEITGATPAGLNCEWRIASIPDANTLTFAVPGIADGSATGTIAVKRASAGWSKPYVSGNRAVFSRPAPGATIPLLQVEETDLQYCTLRSYESMTDANTGADEWTGGLFIRKSNETDSNARTWVLIADARAFYFFPYWNSSFFYPSPAFFGDILTFFEPDPYACAAVLNAISMPAYPGGNGSSQVDFRVINNSVAGHRLCRAMGAASGGGAAFAKHSVNGANNLGGYSYTYPNPQTGGMITADVYVQESSGLRGAMPGMMNPVHNKPVSDRNYLWVNGTPVIVFKMGYSTTTDYGRALIDIMGPWR